MSLTTGSAPISGCTVRPVEALRLHTENVTDSSPGATSMLSEPALPGATVTERDPSPAPDHVRMPIVAPPTTTPPLPMH